MRMFIKPSQGPESNQLDCFYLIEQIRRNKKSHVYATGGI